MISTCMADSISNTFGIFAYNIDTNTGYYQHYTSSTESYTCLEVYMKYDIELFVGMRSLTADGTYKTLLVWVPDFEA